MDARSSSGATSVTSTTRTDTRFVVTRRPRRWLALFALVPLIGGVIETNSRIEDDLEAKALRRGATSADFSAQSGKICAAELDTVLADVADATGVGSVREADDCRQASGPAPTAPATAPDSTPSTTTTAAAPAPSSSAAPTTAPDAGDIVAILAADGSFSTLIELVTAAGLGDVLSGPGPLTVFAPTDEAFAQLDPAVLAALGADNQLLQTALTHHVVDGTVASADLVTGDITALSGEPLSVTVADTITIDADGTASATVVRPDLVASNGVVHVVDAVLIPPSLRPPGSALDASADFDGARIVLTGTVDNEAQREAVVDGAIAAMGGDTGRVDDQLNVADTARNDAVAAADALASQLGGLLATLPANFASGTAAASDAISISGLALDDEALAAAQGDATSAGAAADDIAIEVRPEATAADRDQLIADINALFVDQTVQFAPSSADILDESTALLDTVAAKLLQFDLTGIVITIEGHTDADGSSESNLALSQRRAEAVEQALVDRGISGDALSPVGFGEERPVAPNDTAENKALNRRVTLSAQQ